MGSVNELIAAAGAMAEQLKIMRDAFITAGFTEKEAMELTREWLRSAYGANTGK